MANRCVLFLCAGLSALNLASTNKIEVFKTAPASSRVTICFAGDNLIHKPVITAGYQDDGTRDYTYMYDEIDDYIKKFDVAILNQETPLIQDESKYSGYPMFGSPIEIGEAAIGAGFDVIAQATNHTIDQGIKGVEDSYCFWMQHDIPVLGIHMNDMESDIWYLEEKGIRIALVNYTYGLNGLKLPSGKEYMVDTFDNKDEIAETLEEAENTADITIVIAHWGNEYVYEPTAWQHDMAQFLIDSGADVIFGGHPHVIEPVEMLGDVPVFWSVGNFISGQSEVPRMLGMLAEVEIEKDSKGNVSVVDVNATPTVTHISTYSEQFKVYKLEDYNEDLCSQHRLRRTRGSQMSVDSLWKLWQDIVKQEEEFNEAA
ncbi:MAG: CapA family protein [Lachnospiraceae bacterium]|nr:CapA family protein [Lachnospiraceae bacterium]